ncbi:MAG: glycosyltransferase [Clostridiales bacterium]|nr:glycosyltransferase [Clostridiales bacterium]
MNQIVCLSTSNFNPFPTRKQNVMKRLKESKILYFDPPVSILAPFKDHSARERIFAYKKEGEKVTDSITVYAMPPVLPFYNKFRFINRVNQWTLSRFVKKKMKLHQFQKPVLWCYSPSSCDIIAKIPKRALVYDCVDRHSAYQGMITPAVVDKMEQDLAKKADMVFSTAAGLHETLSVYNQNAVLIPNGAAFEIFSKAAEGGLETPKELSGLSGKIFGFVGMLQECINYDWLEALAKACPNDHLVFIGKPLPGVDLSRFDCYKNVHFLGLKKQAELPAYLSKFDVCLNPFRSGALSKDVSPLKFYEYLATGKPVVTAPEPLQVLDYRDVIYLADSEEEFIKQCILAAGEENVDLRTKRMGYGKECSWDARVNKMEEELKKRKIF